MWATDAPEEHQTWAQWLEGLFFLAFAVADNVLCYVVCFAFRRWRTRGELYNIVDLNLVLLPGIEDALMVFTVIGTLFFPLFVVAECWKHPSVDFTTLMSARLYCSSVPCAVINSILLWNVEDAASSPYLALATAMSFVVCWSLRLRMRSSDRLGLLTKIVVDASWCLSIATLIGLTVIVVNQRMDILTGWDDLGCPYVENTALPVQVFAVETWFCLTWFKKTRLQRQPSGSRSLGCGDTFVETFGASVEVYRVTCPSGCLDQSLVLDRLVGCGAYTADTSICLAAIHDGVLTNAGGAVDVYGQLGLPYYRSCTKNGQTSESRNVSSVNVPVVTDSSFGASDQFELPTTAPGGRRLLTAPAVFGLDGARIPQAFHFNSAIPEFIELKGYEIVPTSDPSVEDGKPWTRVEANVDAHVAGIRLLGERIRLGQSKRQPLYGARPPGQVVSQQQAGECVLTYDGVLCRGQGHATLELDFCLRDVKTCL